METNDDNDDGEIVLSTGEASRKTEWLQRIVNERGGRDEKRAPEGRIDGIKWERRRRGEERSE